MPLAMLEHRTLLLCPRGPDGARAILDAETGAPIGSVRHEPGPWWWPGAAVLAVHEHEDAPLLFTVRRRWGLPPRREVYDADGHRVGDLIGPLVRNEYGR